MMTDIKLKYKIALLSIVCLMVVVSATSFSYAYFAAIVVGNNNAKNIGVTTATINMSFKEGSGNVSLSNAYPISDAEGLDGTPYEFTLTNTNSYNVKVEVLVNVLSSTTMSASYIKVAHNNGSGQITPALLSTKPSPTIVNTFDGVSKSYLIDTVTLTPNKSQTFRVWFWIDANVGGVTNGSVGPSMGKTFNAKIATVTVKSE